MIQFNGPRNCRNIHLQIVTVTELVGRYPIVVLPSSILTHCWFTANVKTRSLANRSVRDEQTIYFKLGQTKTEGHVYC
jgi:hypothetical protein